MDKKKLKKNTAIMGFIGTGLVYLSYACFALMFIVLSIYKEGSLADIACIVGLGVPILLLSLPAPLLQLTGIYSFWSNRLPKELGRDRRNMILVRVMVGFGYVLNLLYFAWVYGMLMGDRSI